MATWTIVGEAGKRLNDIARNISDLDCDSVKLSFRSLSPDTLVLSMVLDDFTVLTNVPELTQQVTLFRDGVTYFRGYVTSDALTVRGGTQSIQIVVSSAWWFAEKTQLMFSQADGSGASRERPSAKYPTGSMSLQQIFQSVINRGAALGVPWQLGSVSPYFNIPAITLNQMSVAQALSELIRVVPDAMLWLDYGANPPLVNVTRRSLAPSRVFTLGTADVDDMSIGPVLQLKVDQVRVPYVTRTSTGRTSYQEQSAGSGPVSSSGIVVVSGPELDTYLPSEEYESAQMRTISSGATSSELTSMVNSTNAEISRLVEIHGPKWFGGFSSGSAVSYEGVFYVGRGERIPYRSSTGDNLAYLEAGRMTFKNSSGATVTGHAVYPGFSPPTWLVDQLGLQPITVSYTCLVVFDWTTGQLQPYLPGIAEFAAGSSKLEGYYNVEGSSRGKRSIYWKTYQFQSWLSPTAYNAPTPVYRAAVGYGFVQPPAGFAANLLNAQNWVPYEGRISFVSDDPGLFQYRGCVVNVANSLPAHATMNALVSAEEIDLLSGTTQVQLGAPPRIDFRTFMDKIRHTPQDNIITKF